MPNGHSYITNAAVSVTGIVGTYSGAGATCIPLTLIHLVDESGEGYASVITNEVNIMDYTEYSFYTLTKSLEDLSYYTIQPQLSLDQVNYFDSTPVITITNFEIGSKSEQSISPDEFGKYARLKIETFTPFSPTSKEDDLNRLANTYVLFHGRLQ